MNAADGAEFRLHDSSQVIRDLILVEIRGRETDVHRSELIVRSLEVDDRRLRFRRKIVTNLRNLGLNLGQRCIRVIVQLQVHGDRAKTLGARRLHVVDAIGTRDHALERRRDKSANQVSVRADVGRRDFDDCDVAARVLTNTKRTNRLQAGNQDHEVDDDRKDRPFYKEIRKLHLAILGLGGRVVSRLNLVVDLDGGSVAQFEDA